MAERKSYDSAYKYLLSSRKRREDARKMLKRGFPVADIADITGLSEQEINSLRQNTD